MPILFRGIAKHLVANKQQPTPDMLYKRYNHQTGTSCLSLLH